MGTMAAAASVLSPETEEMQRLFLIDEVAFPARKRCPARTPCP